SSSAPSSHLTTLPPRRSTLLPYTTLFRSRVQCQTDTRLAPLNENRRQGHPQTRSPPARRPRRRAREWCLKTSAQRRQSCETPRLDRKSTRLNSSHVKISYAVFCLKHTILI